MKRTKLPALPRERKVLTKDDLECYLVNYESDWPGERAFSVAIRRLVQEIVRLRGWRWTHGHQ
jgi:hypothetical protein